MSDRSDLSDKSESPANAGKGDPVQNKEKISLSLCAFVRELV